VICQKEITKIRTVLVGRMSLYVYEIRNIEEDTVEDFLDHLVAAKSRSEAIIRFIAIPIEVKLIIVTSVMGYKPALLKYQ